MILRALLVAALLAGPALACEAPADLAALRADLLALVNADRAGAGLPLLRAEARLDAAAQEQACRIAERGRLTHRGAWLAGLGRRLRRVDYPYALAVENTGLGQNGPGAVVAGWLASPGHRENLRHPGVREAGIGVAPGGRGWAWTLIGAARE